MPTNVPVEVLKMSDSRWVIRRHGLTWNFYILPPSPALFWPNDSVSHPETLTEAIRQVAETFGSWFNQDTLNYGRPKWTPYQMGCIRTHCDCPVTGHPEEN